MVPVTFAVFASRAPETNSTEPATTKAAATGTTALRARTRVKREQRKNPVSTNHRLNKSRQRKRDAEPSPDCDRATDRATSRQRPWGRTDLLRHLVTMPAVPPNSSPPSG